MCQRKKRNFFQILGFDLWIPMIGGRFMWSEATSEVNSWED